MNRNVTSILGLTGPLGRTLLGVYGAGTALIAILNLGGLTVPALGLGSLALLAAALVVLALSGEEPFGFIMTFVVIGLTTLMTLLSAFNIADVANPGYSAWHMGAITFVMLVLTLRGRRALAWAGFGVFAIISVASTFITGQALAASINDVARQAGTLAIGTLFALVLRRASGTIGAIHDAQLLRSSREAATNAAITERGTQNARLERDARPALERLLTGQPLTPEERMAIALLEESLLDGAKAASFTGTQLADEIRAARERGIEVTLLDDRTIPLDGEDRERVEYAIVVELHHLRAGALIAHLLPVDHEELAIISITENSRRRDVTVSRRTAQLERS